MKLARLAGNVADLYVTCQKHIFLAATFAKQLLDLKHLQICVVDIDQ